MGLSIEYDKVNKVLLVRLGGSLTDDSPADIAETVQKCSAATDARAFITDVSSVTDFTVSTECLRRLAKQEPALVEVAQRPNVIVASQAHAFGLARMFQTMGERTRPHLHVVHSMSEAFRVLEILSPHFTPVAAPPA
jgi:hypothetical protein